MGRNTEIEGKWKVCRVSDSTLTLKHPFLLYIHNYFLKTKITFLLNERGERERENNNYIPKALCINS